MATLGNVPAEAYTNTVKDSFSGNGSTTAFTMSLPTVTNDVRVVVENVIQDPTVAYSVSGTTLTFTSAPPSGTNNIYVVHLGPAVMTTVPPAEIADATTFASSLTVQGAFTSPGIDDNADAVALTIDSNENLLIGRTSTADTAVGATLRPDGFVQSTRDGNIAADFNRNTSDGDIVRFSKGSSPVGSIGSRGTGTSYITLKSTSGAGAGLTGSDNRILPMDESALADNNTDLGMSTYRWKDLYLSGGVYLGGTGSANKLDDYEQSTFQPAFYSGSWGYSLQRGDIIRIGNFVQVSMVIGWTSSSSTSDMLVVQLPIQSISVTSARFAGCLGYVSGFDTTGSFKQINPTLSGNSVFMNFYRINDNSAPAFLTNSSCSGSGEVQISIAFTAD